MPLVVQFEEAERLPETGPAASACDNTGDGGDDILRSQEDAAGRAKEDSLKRQPSQNHISTAASKQTPYTQMLSALAKEPGTRTKAEISLIHEQVMVHLQDGFIKQLKDVSVDALCGRVRLEDVPEKTVIMDIGQPANEVYIILNGRVHIENQVDSVDLTSVRGPSRSKEYNILKTLGRFKVFGDAALLTNAERTARVTTAQACKLLVFTKEDYDLALNITQADSRTVSIAFLQSVDRANLSTISEIDLGIFGQHLKEKSYRSEEVILRQGDDADRLVLVKRGFCKVLREISREKHRAFDRYAEPSSSKVVFGEDSADASDMHGSAQDFGLVGRDMLLDTMRQFGADPMDYGGRRRKSGYGAGRETQHAVDSTFKEIEVKRKKSECLKFKDMVSSLSRGGQGAGITVLDHLPSGRSFGCMELLNAMPYQSSLVACPFADVYYISKSDLLRNTPSSILHRFFCEHKQHVEDDQLMERMKQKHRWNDHKRSLLHAIEAKKVVAGLLSHGVDRRTPVPKIVRVGELTDEEYSRFGTDAEFWHGRAATPPMPIHSNKDVPPVLHLRRIDQPDGTPDLEVSWERREASVMALEQRMRFLQSDTRARARRQKIAALVGSPGKSILDLEPSVSERVEATVTAQGGNVQQDATDINVAASAAKPPRTGALSLSARTADGRPFQGRSLIAANESIAIEHEEQQHRNRFQGMSRARAGSGSISEALASARGGAGRVSLTGGEDPSSSSYRTSKTLRARGDGRRSGGASEQRAAAMLVPLTTAVAAAA